MSIPLAVLEDIIEQLQTCIISARALKLEMLEHILKGIHHAAHACCNV